MRKFVCSVCGYVYDEAKGIPQAGIAAGTAWEDLPDDWVCPLCGATKAEFVLQGGEKPTTRPLSPVVAPIDENRALSALEISALCSNLARGCEKQYMAREAADFTRLADFFKASAAPAREASAEALLELVNSNLENEFVLANAAAQADADRGAKRALVWSEKVTRILKSLLTRYAKEGDAMLQNANVYVCTICGFVFVGENPPALCPVCKVPSWKFEKVEGR